MDVVGADTSAGSNSSSINALTATLEITTQRKSKQLLIHIESLYRLVLKLEDKEHPTAMAAHQLIMVSPSTIRQYFHYAQFALLSSIIGSQNEGLRCGHVVAQ